jgi:phosphatidylglycerophosphatase A
MQKSGSEQPPRGDRRPGLSAGWRSAWRVRQARRPVPQEQESGAAPGSAVSGSVPATVLATWFGCGYAPVAPGTAGSAAAIVMGIALERFAGFGRWHFAILAAVLFGPAVWAAGVTAARLGLKDPSIVVVDEVIGQWISLAGAARLNWRSYLLAFVLFRLFDIWKPPPVRQLEELPGGVGINADDVMAGVYAALVLFAAGWFNLY